MSNVVVNELEIKVKSTAAGATASLNKVVSRLDAIQKKMDSFSSRNVVDQLSKINSSLGSKATSSIDKLADSLNKLPAATSNTNAALRSTNSATTAASTSFLALAAKIGLVVNTIKAVSRVVGNWVNQSMDYVETLNLFNATMGEYAEEATAYAEQVEEIMGINIADWMRAQGVFQALATGFGIAGDKAALMSKNLTQLGYDLASFYNISTADAMEKLQSGISGEIEPLRRLGFDLSMARLEEVALANGINQRVDSMTQAEKAQLRYIAVMQQSTKAQGDMARTLNAPANQLRILQANASSAARALGNIFIPALNAILPAAIVALKAIRMVADAIAKFFGFSIPEVDYSGMGGVTSGAGEAADALDDATGSAKKFKQAILGIDELNVIAPQDSSGGGGGAGGGGGGYDFELPEYDFFADAVNSKIQEMMDKLLDFVKLIQSNVPETVFDYVRHSWDRLKESFGEFGEAIQNLFDDISPKEALAKVLADIETLFLNWWGGVLTYLGALFDFGAGGINIFDGITDTLAALFKGEFKINKFVKDILPQMAKGFGQLLDGAVKAAVAAFDFGIFGQSIMLGLQAIDWLALFLGIEIDADGWWIGVKDAILDVDFSDLFAGVAEAFAAWWNNDIDWSDIIRADLVLLEFQNQLNEVSQAIFGEGFKLFGDETDFGIGALFTAFDTLEEKIAPILDIFTPFVDVVMQLKDTFVELGASVFDLFSTMGEYFSSTWEIISPIFDAMNSGLNLSGTLMGIVGAQVSVLAMNFSIAFSAIGTILNYFLTTAKNIIAGVTGAFKGLTLFVKGVFANDWKMAWEGIKTAFLSIIETMVNNGIALINGLISAVESAVNSVISAINSFTGLDFNKVDWDRIDEVNWSGTRKTSGGNRVQTKAFGGFVNTGELFIANEAGPELVGSIGNKTAVANNDQIVTGISAGVYSAMSAALADNDSGDGVINITVKLDSDVIYKATEDKKRQRGYNLGMGEFA